MPKLISATGSYWNGRIPVAISNFSRKFIRSFVHWNCRSNDANGSRVLSWRHDFGKLGQNTRDHAATAVISLAHSAVTYWSCFAIRKHLRDLKNMKWLLRHGIYTCIYCVKIFSRWNIPKRRSEAKISVQGPLMSTETITLIGDGERGWGIYLSLHCHHQNDSCIKMGSDESHSNVSYLWGTKLQDTDHNFWTERRAEGDSNRGDSVRIPFGSPFCPLTTLTPYRYAKPANK